MGVFHLPLETVILPESVGESMDVSSRVAQIKDVIDREIEASSDMDKIARMVYNNLPEEGLIDVFDSLVDEGRWSYLWLVTRWIKRKQMYELRYMGYYERWLYEHIHTWGQCDVLCYRVLNPMLEKHPQLFKNVLRWCDSSKTFVRRAAPVSLLRSSRSFSVHFSWEKVLKVVGRLKDDDEIHVQKGVGWLLKYAYLSYPDEVYDYLKENVDEIPRVVFRYALEKAPKDIRKELMNL